MKNEVREAIWMRFVPEVVPKVSFPPICVAKGTILGVILGAIFEKKSIFFGIAFYIKFGKAFLEDFDGFWSSFS